MTGFPVNPYEVEQDPPEPEPDSCQLGVSTLCTDEAAYLWQGQYVCAHCFSQAEREQEQRA